jgi:hypothetical protein
MPDRECTTIRNDAVRADALLLAGHRVQLNNYVQQMYKNSTSLSWDIQQQGPEHQPSWEAVAYSAY